ncbi:MAG: amidase family protein [Chloroflexota bacterium]
MKTDAEAQTSPEGLIDKIALDSLQHTPFTQVANLSGLPAMSVPLHQFSNGLPCGQQFIAPFGREDRLFNLAGQLEQARPWFDKRPGSVSGEQNNVG